MMKLTMLSRSYCHLCDVMQADFETWKAQQESLGDAGKCPNIGHLQAIDIDVFAEYEALWGDKVPVLLLNDAEVCHYHFDAEKLTAALAALSE